MSERTIGRYEIVRELGRGGMATVYLGRDPKLDRQVAIKVLPSQFANDPEFFDRFEQEAKTLATLQHNAIVSLYDSGEDEGFPYFIMQLMEGGSLKEKITDNSLEPEGIITIFSRIAAALDKAHNSGIVHRDVKPSNILFDDDGEAYLSDFGIVKLTQATDTVTRTGGSIGTPHYMSPEQLDGVKDLDGRADIYALAVVLYETLIGEPPYNHPSSPRIMVMHLNEPIPDVLEKRPDLPLAIDAIIKKGMAKDRDERYSKASDLANDLKKALQNWVPGQESSAAADLPPGTPEEPIQSEPDIATPEASSPIQTTEAVEPAISRPISQPIPPVTNLKNEDSGNNGNSMPWLYALAGAGGVAILVLGVIGIIFLNNNRNEAEPTPTNIAAILPTEESTATSTKEATATPTPLPTSTSTATLAPVVTTVKEPTATDEPTETAEPTATPTATEEPTATATRAPTLDDALAVLKKSEDLLQFPDLFETNRGNRTDPSFKFHDEGVALNSSAKLSTIVYLPFEESPDGYYETEIEFLSGDMTNAWAGIILRVSENGDRYYLFEINGSGQVRGSRIDPLSDEIEYIGSSRLFDARGQQVETGLSAKNKLGIQIDGTTLEFFINQSNRGGFTFKDTFLKLGGVGLSTRVDSGGGSIETNFSYLVFK